MCVDAEEIAADPLRNGRQSFLKKKRWFVYSKRPFAGPKAVLAYLSRYTHRVAISRPPPDRVRRALHARHVPIKSP
jgi:hypothetical protein